MFVPRRAVARNPGHLLQCQVHVGDGAVRCERREGVDARLQQAAVVRVGRLQLRRARRHELLEVCAVHPKLLLGQPGLGHILHVSLDGGQRARVVEHAYRAFRHPADVTRPVDDPVGDVVLRRVVHGRLDARPHHLPVVRVDQRRVRDGGVAQKVPGGVPGETFATRAYELHGPVAVVCAAERHPGEVAQQGVEPPAGLPPRPLRVQQPQRQGALPAAVQQQPHAGGRQDAEHDHHEDGLVVKGQLGEHLVGVHLGDHGPGHSLDRQDHGDDVHAAVVLAAEEPRAAQGGLHDGASRLAQGDAHRQRGLGAVAELVQHQRVVAVAAGQQGLGGPADARPALDEGEEHFVGVGAQQHHRGRHAVLVGDGRGHVQVDLLAPLAAEQVAEHHRAARGGHPGQSRGVVLHLHETRIQRQEQAAVGGCQHDVAVMVALAELHAVRLERGPLQVVVGVPKPAQHRRPDDAGRADPGVGGALRQPAFHLDDLQACDGLEVVVGLLLQVGGRVLVDPVARNGQHEHDDDGQGGNQPAAHPRGGGRASMGAGLSAHSGVSALG